MTELSSAWLVKFEYRAVKMRAFTSYDKAVTYYNEMVQNIDEQIEESYYETKTTYTDDHKPLLTQFIYWNEDRTFRNILGFVSIKEIELEEN